MEYMDKRKDSIEAYYMSLPRWKPVMDDPKMYLATPATQVLLALREALREVKQEGLEARWARHRKLGETARNALDGMGVEVLADEGFRADTITAFWVQEGTAGGIQHALDDKYNIMVSRGLYEAKDKMIRIGHFGILTVDKLKRALALLESVMEEMGATGKKSVQLAKRK